MNTQPKPGDALQAMMNQRAAAWRRLEQIAEVIETVDNRCAAADGFVTPTRLEMTDDELRSIYQLAKGQV